MLGKVQEQKVVFAVLTNCSIVYTAFDQVYPKLNYFVVDNFKS